MSAPVVSPEDHLRAGGPDAVLAAARTVAADLATRAAGHDRDGTYPAENVAALWAAGLGNLTLPAAYGGVGAGLETTARAVEIIAGGDASTALILVMHLNQLALITDADSPWPEPLRRQVVESTLAGPALLNMLHVEPELGTPSRGGVPASRVVPATLPDGTAVWRLNGHKIYSTGSYGLRWMLVSAATPDDDGEGQRVGTFVVPGGSPGIEIVETWDHLGMRATASHDVVFHDVIIPRDHVVALKAPGTRNPRDTRRVNVLIAALYLGVAEAARDWLARYLNERAPANLGAPLASLPRFQSEMGEIEAALYQARQLTHGLAARIDRDGGGGPEVDAETPLVKMTVARLAIEAVQRGMALIGNPGLSRHHPLERHQRDVLCSRIHWPQDDFVLLGAGRAALARGKP